MSEMLNTKLDVAVVASDMHDIAVDLANYSSALAELATKFDDVANDIDEMVGKIQSPENVIIAKEYISKRTKRLEIPAINNMDGYGNKTTGEYDNALENINIFYNDQVTDCKWLQEHIKVDNTIEEKAVEEGY
jgi:hypothetical protein